MNIIRYYHEECLEKVKNKSYDEKRGFYTNESIKHKFAKEWIFNWLINYEILLIDQFGEKHNLLNDFISTESPVVNELKGGKVPFHQFGSCV